MANIEVESFFYDLFHCKDKILESFDEWDEKYDNDERGALVAGIRDCPDSQLIPFLMNVQKLAAGYARIQEKIQAAEQAEVDAELEDDEDDDDDDD